MSKRLVAAFLCSAISLVGSNGLALADVIGRYECNLIGPTSPEPIGDRNGHSLLVIQYSCVGVDGLLKGAVYTASSISEWDGPKAVYVSGGGIHRTPGGLAVTQLTEGTGSIGMQDGKPTGNESSGKAVFKFASGILAALSGKAVRFTSKSTGFNRFNLEFAD